MNYKSSIFQFTKYKNTTFAGIEPPSDTSKLWLDTSVSPPVLKSYDGTEWKELNENIVKSLETISEKQSEMIIDMEGFKTNVSNTYATKTELETVDGKFSSYSTTTEMNTAIDQSAENLKLEASETFSSKVELEEMNESIDNQIKTLSSSINLNAENIESKVSKDSIISEINQSAEEVKIDANKITLEGLVTANSYFKILEDGSMETTNGKFTGNVTANSGNIGGFDVSEDGLKKSVSIQLKKQYDSSDMQRIKDIIMGRVEKTNDDMYYYDVNGDGKITSVDYLYIDAIYSKINSNILITEVEINPKPFTTLGIDSSYIFKAIFKGGGTNGTVACETVIGPRNIKTNFLAVDNNITVNGKGVLTDDIKRAYMISGTSVVKFSETKKLFLHTWEDIAYEFSNQWGITISDANKLGAFYYNGDINGAWKTCCAVRDGDTWCILLDSNHTGNYRVNWTYLYAL